MNTLLYLTVFGLISIVPFKATAQNLYTLNLSDSSNFSTTDGKVNPGKWTVKDAYCSLTTASVIFPGRKNIDPPMVAPVTITFSTTGNIECEEMHSVFIRYSINNGNWYTQSSINTCAFNKDGSFKLVAPAGASVRLMISIAVSKNKDKIWIKDKDISIGTPVVANSATWTK